MTNLPARMALVAMMLPLADAAIAQSPPMAAAPTNPGAYAAPPAGGQAGEQMGGSMTLAQYQARQLGRIMAADTDGDGRISLAEWTAAMSGRRGGGGGVGGGGRDPSRMFVRMDTNHDGFLDRGEIDAASAERFRRMDANGDGVVAPDERAAMRGGGRRGMAGGAGRGAPGPDGAGTPPPQQQP